MNLLIAIGLILFATYIIAKACDGFEVGSDYAGRNLSDGVKGASINAIGSSMPEILTTFIFLFVFSNTSGFAGGIGTTAGSAVFNSMIIPALVIIAAIKMFKIQGIKVSKKVILRDGLMLIAAEVVLIVTIGDRLEWWHGLMLMLMYVGYALYMFGSMSKKEVVNCENSNEDNDNSNEYNDSSNEYNNGVGHTYSIKSLIKLDLEGFVIGEKRMNDANSWGLLAISTIFISIACYFLVYGCELLGESIGVHGYFIAVILAAAASSVPDTILSVKDAKKGNYDDAVANALGSNIFDICFALGLPLFIYTLIYGAITMSPEMVSHISELRVLLLLLTIGVFFILLFGKSIGKIKALILLAMYSLFTIYIVARANESEWIEVVVNGLHSIKSFL